MKKGFLLTEPVWGVIKKIPIKILQIVETDIFPVKFEYAQRGYKGLTFSERLNKVEIL